MRLDLVTSAVLGTLSQNTSILISPKFVCKVTDITTVDRFLLSPPQHGYCGYNAIGLKQFCMYCVNRRLREGSVRRMENTKSSGGV